MLDDFAASISLKGWEFWVTRDEDHQWLHMAMIEHPPDRDSVETITFGDSFLVPVIWDREALIIRLFCTLQFLVDHELREQFTIDGVRIFEAHDPSVTGPQKDWFVERSSALLGYE